MDIVDKLKPQGCDGLVDHGGWRCVSSIPRGRWVEALTVTGLVRETRINERWANPVREKFGKLRIECFSRTGGDIVVVKWRPILRVVI